MRLSENAHLPFDKPFDELTVLSKVDPSTSLRVDAEPSRSIEGLRYPRPASGICNRAGFRKAQLAAGHFPPASKKLVF